MKTADTLFGTAITLMPVSYATKSLLGLENTLWIDPSLLLGTVAFLLLLPRWGELLSNKLRPAFLWGVGLAIAIVPAMISGLLLRPTPLLYDIVREPIRYWLLLVWTIAGCWFLYQNPKMVFRCTAAAVFLALISGLYLYGIVLGQLPANATTITYARIYYLRQAIWVDGFPVPRMGGLFIEAPPFGLFMFSATIVLLCGWRRGYKSFLIKLGIWVSILGTVLSLTDQVLLGAALGLGLALPSLNRRKSWYFWPILLLALALASGLVIRSISVKGQQFTGTSSALYINGSSIGERTFHTRYALTLLTSEPPMTLLGLGPGRYGEYAAETGYFPASVTMQFSIMEILSEWGVAGFTLIAAGCVLFLVTLWRHSGIPGAALFLGLLLANSLQSNWKWESAFLAIAALYCDMHTRQTYALNGGGLVRQPT